jgi:hypothetical protein
MTSKAAQQFVSEEIEHQKAKGKSQKQAEAIALNVARKKGYNVPKYIRNKEKLP